MAVSIFWLRPNVLAAYKFTNLAFFFETWSAWLIFFTYNFLKQYLGKFLGYLVHDGKPILCCCKFDIKSKPGAAAILITTRKRLKHSSLARRKASTYPTAYGDTLTPSRTKSNWGSTSASVRARAPQP